MANGSRTTILRYRHNFLHKTEEMPDISDKAAANHPYKHESQRLTILLKKTRHFVREIKIREQFPRIFRQ